MGGTDKKWNDPKQPTIVVGNRLDLYCQQNFAYKNMWKTSSVKLIIVSVD